MATKRAAGVTKAPAKRATKAVPPSDPAENGDEDIFYLNVRIPMTLRERMEVYCNEYGVGRRYLVTRAIEEYLDARAKNPPA